MIYKVIQLSPYLQALVNNYLLLNFPFDNNGPVSIKSFPLNQFLNQKINL